MEKFKEIYASSELDNKKISKDKSIYDNMYGEVFLGEYDGKKVVVKSFYRKRLELNDEKFINELINLKSIHLKFDYEKISSYFSEFIGFSLNDSESDPFFGNILIKYYPLGDLCIYSRKLSDPTKFKNYDKFNEEQKEDSLKEVLQLVDLAKQIAEGKFVLNKND